MKIEYKTNYSGFFIIFRTCLFLLKEKKLNLTQLGAYLVFISQVSFDKEHKHYKAIIRSDQEIAQELGISYDTIHKHRKDLIALGLFVEKNGITYVPNFYMFEWESAIILIKHSIGDLRQLFVDPPKDVDYVPEELVKIQTLRAQKKRKGFNISSKDNSHSSEVDITEELREYFQENDIETDEYK